MKRIPWKPCWSWLLWDKPPRSAAQPRAALPCWPLLWQTCCSRVRIRQDNAQGFSGVPWKAPSQPPCHLYPSILLSFFEARTRGMGQIRLCLITSGLFIIQSKKKNPFCCCPFFFFVCLLVGFFVFFPLSRNSSKSLSIPFWDQGQLPECDPRRTFSNSFLI